CHELSNERPERSSFQNLRCESATGNRCRGPLPPAPAGCAIQQNPAALVGRAKPARHDGRIRPQLPPDCPRATNQTGAVNTSGSPPPAVPPIYAANRSARDRTASASRATPLHVGSIASKLR